MAAIRLFPVWGRLAGVYRFAIRDDGGRAYYWHSGGTVQFTSVPGQGEAVPEALVSLRNKGGRMIPHRR